jgi:hypothetical protein
MMPSRGTYFLVHYQRGEKIHKGLLLNPLLTGGENIFVSMARVRISFSSKLFWKKGGNGIQLSLHHKMTQGEDTREIYSLFRFDQQNAGQKWLWFCLFSSVIIIFD